MHASLWSSTGKWGHVTPPFVSYALCCWHHCRSYTLPSRHQGCPGHDQSSLWHIQLKLHEHRPSSVAEELDHSTRDPAASTQRWSANCCVNRNKIVAAARAHSLTNATGKIGSCGVANHIGFFANFGRAVAWTSNDRRSGFCVSEYRIRNRVLGECPICASR